MVSKVTEGSSLATSPLRSAGFVNSVVDSVADYNRRALGVDADDKFTPLPPDCVKIKNFTSDDLDRGYVVQLGPTLLDDLNSNYPWFEADYPAAPLFYNRFAVLLEPIKAGKIGLAQIAGCCVASLTVLDTNHTHAIPVDGDGELITDFIGPIEILNTLTETGAHKLAFVRLAVPPPELLVKGDADIAKGDSATVRIYTGALDGPPSDSGFDLEDAFSFFTDYPADAWAEVNLLNGNKSIHVIECGGGGGGGGGSGEDGLPDPDTEALIASQG